MMMMMMIMDYPIRNTLQYISTAPSCHDAWRIIHCYEYWSWKLIISATRWRHGIGRSNTSETGGGGGGGCSFHTRQSTMGAYVSSKNNNNLMNKVNHCCVFGINAMAVTTTWHEYSLPLGVDGWRPWGLGVRYWCVHRHMVSNLTIMILGITMDHWVWVRKVNARSI